MWNLKQASCFKSSLSIIFYLVSNKIVFIKIALTISFRVEVHCSMERDGSGNLE